MQTHLEVWAGKLTKHHKYKFFSAVDGRNTRDEEDDASDPYVKHRTTCAQLCVLLIERQANPWNYPSIKASDLDALYQKYTHVESGSNLFEKIEEIFDDVERIVEVFGKKGTGRRKVPKMALFALSMFVQELRRSPNIRLLNVARETLADAIIDPSVGARRGNSSGVIKDYYDQWSKSLPDRLGIYLDPNRIFSDADKRKIWAKTNGKCAVCGETVADDEAEYDHYPTPHRLGGATTVDNGRLVHKEKGCHPRGRPRDDEE